MHYYLEDGYENLFDCPIIQKNLKVYQNNRPRDMFSLKNTMRLTFCISDVDKLVFHGDMIIIKQVFYLYFTTVK